MIGRIEEAAAERGLSLLGVALDGLPEGVAAMALLGCLEPGFWTRFKEQPEFQDGLPDPMDRWSRRAVGGLAELLGAQAYFPFGGPPHHPFVQWALASGRAHVSPAGLLVHDEAGLWLSFRGALGFAEAFDRPAPPPSPCESCAERPCASACPVGALKGDRYDVASCKEDLDRDGNDCMARGCAARRACPVGRSHGRLEAQSAFHMRAFR